MASEPSLTTLLLDAQSPDFQRRVFAETQLQQAESSNLVEYLKALATEVADETKPETVRQLAGLVFKNAISGRDVKIDSTKRQRWIELSPNVAKAEIRQYLLDALESPVIVARNAACQAISKIARIELPTGAWPQLMPKLEQLAANTTLPIKRTAAYQVIGYVCEDLQILSDEVGRDLLENTQKKQLLTCLSVGLVDSDLDVKLAALKAFYHGILFADEFVANDADRNTLFQVLGECLTTLNEQVELAAWEVLLQMATEYYAALAPYMPQLRDLSIQRMQGESMATQLSAIEFWSTICDEEIAIEEGEETQVQQSEHYVLAAKDVLLPVLFETTTRQNSEDTDEDEWTVSMAAGTCVSLCAQVLRDQILPQALIFIEANFTHARWQRRDAAVMIYGSILEGPSPQAFAQLLQKSFEPLCKCLNDESKAVRDTTAWTIGRIAKFHMGAVEDKLGQTPEQPGVISLLVKKLSDEPRVAAHCCFALFEVFAAIEDNNVTPESTRLDPFFTTVAEALVTVSRRSDASEHRLRDGAYHTLYMLVRQVGSGPEIMNAMEILLNQLLEWMQETLQVAATDEVFTIQGLMCGTLNALIARLEKRVLNQSDRVYQILSTIIANQKQLVETSGGAAGWHTSTEEALLATGQLIRAMQQNFSRYLPSFAPLLIAVMNSREDSDICGIAIDIVGNLATQVGDDFAPHVGLLVDKLFAVLRDGSAPIMLKPKAMATLSDVVMMLPRAFEPYLREYFDFLRQAAAAKLNQGPIDSEEWVNYILELRDATLTAYTAAIYCVRDVSTSPSATAGRQATTTTPATSLMEAEVARILEFIYTIMGDVVSSNSNLKNAVQLAQDLVQFYKGTLVAHIQNHPLYQLLKERCQQVDDPEIRQQLMVLDELMTRNSIAQA